MPEEDLHSARSSVAPQQSRKGSAYLTWWVAGLYLLLQNKKVDPYLREPNSIFKAPQLLSDTGRPYEHHFLPTCFDLSLITCFWTLQPYPGILTAPIAAVPFHSAAAAAAASRMWCNFQREAECWPSPQAPAAAGSSIWFPEAYSVAPSAWPVMRQVSRCSSTISDNQQILRIYYIRKVKESTFWLKEELFFLLLLILLFWKKN